MVGWPTIPSARNAIASNTGIVTPSAWVALSWVHSAGVGDPFTAESVV